VAGVAPVVLVDEQLLELGGEAELLVEFAQQYQPASPVIVPPSNSTRSFDWNLEPESTMTLCSHRHPSTPAADAAFASASIADSESVGGFFIGQSVNFPG
jgi:hypothetical protein